MYYRLKNYWCYFVVRFLLLFQYTWHNKIWNFHSKENIWSYFWDNSLISYQLNDTNPMNICWYGNTYTHGYYIYRDYTTHLLEWILYPAWIVFLFSYIIVLISNILSYLLDLNCTWLEIHKIWNIFYNILCLKWKKPLFQIVTWNGFPTTTIVVSFQQVKHFTQTQVKVKL